MLNKIH